MTTQPKPKKAWRWARLLLALCALLLLLGMALPVLRGAQQDPTATPTASVPIARPTLGPVAQREAAYQADVAALQALARDEAADAQARADAGAALAALTERHGLQADLTAALEAMGYAPCLALYQNDALTLLLAAPSLDGAQTAQLLSLCLTHLPVRAENVRLVTGAQLE